MVKCSVSDDEVVRIPKWVIALTARLLLIAFVIPISVAVVGFFILLGILAQGQAVRAKQDVSAERLEQVSRDVENLPQKVAPR